MKLNGLKKPLIKSKLLGRDIKPTYIVMEKTIGEQRVRVDFNVSNDDIVHQIKIKSAELIDLCETLKAKDGRLASLAQTEFETAAMWAVKAATA